jgi:Family of unknown function (DUF6683)
MLRLGPALRHVAVACAPIAALIALAAVAAPTAQAACDDIRWEVRWQPDPFGTSGGSLIRVPVCHDAAPTPRPSRKKARPREPTRSQLRALRFRPSDTVSATVRQRMIQQLAHGEQADAIRAQIESGDLMRQFSAQVRKQEWSTRDLGDMYALAYLQLWLVANDQRSTRTEVDRAVRRELRRQLALDRRAGGASDAKQQETAEWLGSWTVVLAGTINHLRTLGDPARVEDFRERARRLIRAPDLLGVDLTKIRLTRRGVERRAE